LIFDLNLRLLSFEILLSGGKNTKNIQARNLAFGALKYIYALGLYEENVDLVYLFFIVRDIVPRRAGLLQTQQ
jgi:hypothetical protein